MDASTSILPFSDASAIAGATTEAFGQAEPLTRRLAHILQLYPEVRDWLAGWQGGGRTLLRLAHACAAGVCDRRATGSWNLE